ncbi:MAG: cadherin-like domain-containing protein, partial [Cyanobacteriota bacterium]|nr:cadherin-like domain-containing protein [Cyanobacteriota bacterium]
KPALTGEQAILKTGSEDVSYTLREADLLEGFTDADGDDLSVVEMEANNGKVSKNSNGSWTFIPNNNFFGTVDINYRVDDGNSNSIAASNSFVLKQVNDAPSLTGEKAELDSGKINRVVELKSSDLLSGFSDIEGDQLSINNLKAKDGRIQQNGPQTWSLTPRENFTGTVTLSYEVSDGNGGSTPASQSVEILSSNNIPTLTGETSSFTQSNKNFKARTGESSAILIRTRDLLKGYSDPDGDPLSVSGLQASGGSLEQKDKDTWLFTPDRESSKLIELSYTIEDSQGGTTFVSNTIFNEQEQGSRRSGTKRRDILSGTRGDDDLTGLKGHDKLSGLGGDDVLSGGAGKDQLKGGQGDDELIGGRGKDRLWGNDGSDLFIVSQGAGYDVIADFDPNEDLIQLGDGSGEIDITSRRGHALIYQGDDLIARVTGMGDSLSLTRDVVV